MDNDESSSTWGNCQSIFQHLSRHYITKRSVVLIVDTAFENMTQKKMVNKKVFKFFEQLDDQDYFGCITLDSKNEGGEIMLE